MTWTNAVSNLRTQLSDGPTDKLRYRKRCFDQSNGTNKIFKTFEFRRVSSFTGAALPVGVFIDGAPAAVVSDVPEVGVFELSAAPLDGQVVECTYYAQWFTDIELQVFLTMAANWLGFGDNFSDIQEGLRPAATKYAVADAYQKLALRFAENLSETYRLEDSADPKRMDIVGSYRSASNDSRKEAIQLRDHFFTRQGRSLQPLFRTIAGRVADPTPKR